MTRSMAWTFLYLWSLCIQSFAFRAKQKVTKCNPPLVVCAHDPRHCCSAPVTVHTAPTLQTAPVTMQVAAPRVTYSPVYRIGDSVDYLSSQNVWYPATVTGFHSDSGNYDLDVTGTSKTDVPFQKLRAKGGGVAMTVSIFNDGDLVKYSSTNNGVVNAKIVQFHPTTGLYDLLIHDAFLKEGVAPERLRPRREQKKQPQVIVGRVNAQQGVVTNTQVSADGIPVASCTKQTQPTGGSGDGPLVVAIGDSLTEGKDAKCPGYQASGQCLWWAGSCEPFKIQSKEQAKGVTCGGEMDPWPSQLQREIPTYRVLNRGCYGQSLEDMIGRVRAEIPPQIKDRVAVVTVMAGTNNLWASNATETYVQSKLIELHGIIQRELAPAAKLVVMTIPQGGPGMMGATKAKVEKINNYLRATYSNKQQNGIYFVDTYTGLDYTALDRTGHPMMYDNTHFGPGGYALIVERLLASGAFD